MKLWLWTPFAALLLAVAMLGGVLKLQHDTNQLIARLTAIEQELNQPLGPGARIDQTLEEMDLIIQMLDAMTSAAEQGQP